MSESRTKLSSGADTGPDDDLGASKFPLCREPWESYYILRRGILPCCYGNPIIAPMADYEAAWNSTALREIRSHLGRGKLSPYCLESLGCPIVQRIMAKKKDEGKAAELPPSAMPRFLRLLNRLMFRIPGRIRRAWLSRRPPGNRIALWTKAPGIDKLGDS